MKGSTEFYNSSRAKYIGVAVLVAALTCVFTILFWLVIFQYISAPTFLKYTGLADSFILKDPPLASDAWTNYAISQMLQNGNLISLDDVWSFQSSFYQTLITFLIAINGLLGVLAFFVIRSSSDDKAEESAIKHSRIYIESADFENRINSEVRKRVKAVQDDYNSTVNDLNKALKQIEDQQAIIDKVTLEQVEIKRYIKIISKAVSNSDKEEDEGSYLIIDTGRDL